MAILASLAVNVPLGLFMTTTGGGALQVFAYGWMLLAGLIVTGAATMYLMMRGNTVSRYSLRADIFHFAPDIPSLIAVPGAPLTLFSLSGNIGALARALRAAWQPALRTARFPAGNEKSPPVPRTA